MYSRSPEKSHIESSISAGKVDELLFLDDPSAAMGLVGDEVGIGLLGVNNAGSDLRCFIAIKESGDSADWDKLVANNELGSSS
jgi:hypothetical protein